MANHSFIDLLGIKCLKSDANTIKKILITSNLLSPNAKAISEKDFIIFPLIEDFYSTNLPESLQNQEISTYSFPEILRISSIEKQLMAIIPKKLHSFIPKSYDIIGKILLIKLDFEILPYKQEIGQVYLKNLRVDSIFRKSENITSPYRITSWDCIGGVDNSITTHKMNDLDFLVNIKSVYFNPRLNNEYLIVSDQVNAKEIIWDLFCGIGPFSLTLAHKKDVIVYANDINTSATTFLKQNIEINKKKLIGTIFPYTLDAKQAVFELPTPDRIFMNLPETAKDFLPSIFQRIDHDHKKDVTIYLYHFTHKVSSDRRDLGKNIELQQLLDSFQQDAKNNDIIINSMTSRIVRDVSPNKSHFVTELRISARKA